MTEISFTTPETLKEIIRETIVECLKSQSSLSAQSHDPEEYLTRKEAYLFLRIGSTKFNELRNAGIVKPTRIGRKTIYKKSHLLEIANENITTM